MDFCEPVSKRFSFELFQKYVTASVCNGLVLAVMRNSEKNIQIFTNQFEIAFSLTCFKTVRLFANISIDVTEPTNYII